MRIYRSPRQQRKVLARVLLADPEFMAELARQAEEYGVDALSRDERWLLGRGRPIAASEEVRP